MLRKPLALVATALLSFSVLAAGCGDDGAATTSTLPAVTTTSAVPTSTTRAPTTTIEPPSTTTEPPSTTTEPPSTTQVPTADGELIAFSRQMPDGSLEVFTVDPATGATTQVTDGFATALMPVWSQDRSLLAFWSMDTGEEYIWTVGADGSNPTQITEFSSAVPDWWRGEGEGAGDFLVFNSDSGGEPTDVPDIYLVPLDIPDGKVQMVDADASSDYRPRISHDGNHLLFVSDRDGSEDLWVLTGDTGELVNLTGGMGGYEATGDWSPDGTAIAFVSIAADPDIWVMEADGSNPRLLVGGPGSQDSPSWSPDGTRIAYTSDEGGLPALWIVDADGGTPTQLTSGDTADMWPDWW